MLSAPPTECCSRSASSPWVMMITVPCGSLLTRFPTAVLPACGRASGPHPETPDSANLLGRGEAAILVSSHYVHQGVHHAFSGRDHCAGAELGTLAHASKTRGSPRRPGRRQDHTGEGHCRGVRRCFLRRCHKSYVYLGA